MELSPDSTVAKKPRLTEKTRYPWDKWADGREHIIKPKVNFTVSPRMMASAIYSHARRKGKKALVSLKEGVVTFRIFDEPKRSKKTAKA